MGKGNKLLLPASILIASIILGGFYYFSEIHKQQSLEKQETDLSTCLGIARTDYVASVKLNGTVKADGSIFASDVVWDRYGKDKQTAIDNCFKQYK